MGFSSTGKAEQGTAEEFQPLSCTIRYGFGQIPQNVFLPHRQHSYLLGWDSGEPRCAAGWQAAGSQLLCLLRHLQGGWARYSMQVTTRQGPGAPSTTTVAATRANLPHSNHRQGRPQRQGRARRCSTTRPWQCWLILSLKQAGKLQKLDSHLRDTTISDVLIFPLLLVLLRSEPHRSANVPGSLLVLLLILLPHTYPSLPHLSFLSLFSVPQTAFHHTSFSVRAPRYQHTVRLQRTFPRTTDVSTLTNSTQLCSLQIHLLSSKKTYWPLNAHTPPPVNSWILFWHI